MKYSEHKKGKEQLSRVHSTFHVSNLKKCLFDETLAIPLDEIQIDDKLQFIKEPVKIMDREVKSLKQSRILIVKRFGILLVVNHSGLVYCSGDLSRKYTVLAVCHIVHCVSGLSFLTVVCLITQSLDTRPPMLDRTGFASWQQRIRLYCQGKENGVNILKSIDGGPFQMGTFRETLAEGKEGAFHLGPERPRVYSDISSEKRRDIWDNVKMLLEGSELTKEDRELQLYDDFEHFCQHKEETIHNYYIRFSKLINDMRNIKMTMYRMNLNLKVDKIEVWGTMHRVQVQLVMKELKTELGMQIQTMFMANLSSADLVYDEASPSYDSNILSDVPDHENYQDTVCEHHEVHEMHDNVQPHYIVESHTDYANDSITIPYD
nr:integrase, catalytic region, zinc finger, CCHC-type, peptidase aspartic, catalytic [Tanacetum cinerariifolium]